MKRGFTLIELMVVIAIAVILTIGSIAGISASRSRKQVKTTAEKLKYVIEEAISEARAPSDSSFGVQKIEVDVYPNYSSDQSLKNQVKVYNVVGNTKTEIARLSFISVNLSQPSNCDHIPNVNFLKYYYFKISATGNNIGQITDMNPSISTSVSINVNSGNPSGSDVYIVNINALTGLVRVTKGP
ncbi:MAG: hypothetical protein US31_C0009G0028 [Berkelbacteria bacterium GW2011_GWA1_36_9]|uniref:Uncharacterized protein n=1 Tax=Berkelbacteria bacterium GW2011_GWA1_36_9 TaxID=1618331 RepID=A0A0G0I1L4_9BACT|nr:MAG: hypothetical protein US31_C0009G0028 [Berkelbacteria bacterium GW2011_GWA1_36_9]